MSKLLIFNPEHDLALAVGKGSYTPPEEVRKLKKEKSLLPALYADNGDFILVPQEVKSFPPIQSELYKVAQEKNLRLVTPEALADFFNKGEKDRNVLSQDTDFSLIEGILPWGWDHAVRNQLVESGVPERLMPSLSQIEDIRNLSHRRQTIPMRKEIAKYLGEELINLPKELFHEEEVEEFLSYHPIAYFKAPWSSSGRGIVVSDHITHKGLMEWAHGVIKKQGSVMVEPVWDRVIDFATEWLVEEGKPQFLGVSVFETSSRGKYHGNISSPQHDLLRIIQDKAPSFGPEIIDAQKNALCKIVSPIYKGYLGIDMLADREGRVNPCVELNLRMTMGLVEIIKETKII